jgi:hypothetical protein
MAEEQQIDASDPTKIYTFAGMGVKYTDYTNDESMTEARMVFNLGLSPNDMVLGEIGYGWHRGDKVPGSNSGITNARVRWFHLFDMDNDVEFGYRGLGTQVDLQVAGALKGTDGQNVLSFGVLPAFSLGERLALYIPINAINSWDKKFEKYNGFGLGINPLLTVGLDDWWDGGYLSIWPGYSYFLSGDLKNDGSGNLDISLGGDITPTILWMLTYQKNYDVDLKTFRRDRDSGLVNDQNIFFQVTSYF